MASIRQRDGLRNPSRPLPFSEIDPRVFEKLCSAVLAAQPGILRTELSTPGKGRDYGADVVAHLDGGGLLVAQCKRYRQFRPAQIKKASDEFLDHFDDYWRPLRVARYILMAACDLSFHAVATQKLRFEKLGLEYEHWPAGRLRSELAKHREIVRGFRVLQHLEEEICGPDPQAKENVALLRSEPCVLSVAEMREMVRAQGFHHPSDTRRHGLCEEIHGTFKHAYEPLLRAGENLVLDRATGLIWQRSGSREKLTWSEGQAFASEQRRQRLGGATDWRLPTLEELASLLQPAPMGADVFIDPAFDPLLSQCWSADLADGHRLAWNVVFRGGYINRNPREYRCRVRLVRSAEIEREENRK